MGGNIFAEQTEQLRVNAYKLMDQLLEAEKYGDNVSNQISILTRILERIDKLIQEQNIKPWEQLGVSRSTWYRDQARARENDVKRKYELKRIVGGLDDGLDNEVETE